MEVGYAVRLAPGFLGGYFVTCRDLPELCTHGVNWTEALLRASEVMDLVLRTHLDLDEAVPWPSPIRVGEQLVKPSETVQSLLRPYFSLFS
ncbi:type II toxin-antitoxin system HicB family antitoxin [Aquincola sp. J276]|uniref:type II toxin-antitoxin system HicB family antitoxin n=1 Tax=Aquincola sp. J276 TaxID=2898432 RepID=UPI0021506FA6|nr:type II toxin-antitoxin system HicB family antitoxin [Aquincola sp. J276]MCR5868155.1 type II toxin-antitoxin system HicB family antitoxin [Aquincola sp. J276]